MKKESVCGPTPTSLQTCLDENAAGDTFQTIHGADSPNLCFSMEDFMLNWVFLLTTESHGQIEGGWKCFSPGLTLSQMPVLAGGLSGPTRGV